MDQHIAKGDDLREFADATGRLRIGFCQSVDRLADDLEVALDGLPQETVGAIVIQRLALGDLMNAAASRTSSKNFGVLGCIEQLPGPVRFPSEIGVPHG